jgi:DNA recombination protein RmuC
VDLLVGLTALLVGLAAGGALGWMLAAGRLRTTGAETTRAHAEAAAVARAEVAALRERLGQRDRDAAQLAERAGAAETAAAAEKAVRRSEQEAAVVALQMEREAASERERLLVRRDEELREAFQALSAEALARNNDAFVRLAEGRIKEAAAGLAAKADGDLTARAQAISAMLEPVSATLQRVEGQLRTVEKDRATAYAGLRDQVSAMQTEAKQLVNALRAPQVRGRWGELQLERIVELAGMVEHCDFNAQVHTPTADGAVRPDMVVHLAGGKQIVLDAKVPFSAYLEAVEARDPDVHLDKLGRHARQLRGHVDALSAKGYWATFEPTPEFVVLFVPGDPFLEAAVQTDPALLEYAFERNVVIATPTTLIALLRTVNYTWRQEALTQNAQEIRRLGRELHARLATMGAHVAKLGRSLGGAVDSYNQTVASLEARVLVTARQFKGLQVSDDELPEQTQVERLPRVVAAPELVASADDALIALPDLDPGQGGHRGDRPRGRALP